MKIKLALCFILLSTFLPAHAGQQVLADITPPKDLDNIHVVKLASDAHATDFVIFVKKQVPLHKHIAHTETLYILEGTGTFQLGKERFEIQAGDYINVPESTPHAVVVTSTTPLKVLSVQAPEFFGKDRVKVETEELTD